MTIPKFAFVQARWHAQIVDQARVGFIDEIGAAASIDLFDVPGAFEMPLRAQELAQTGTYAGVICAAFVVDGGIYRHEFVAQAVVDGLMQVGLTTGVPIFSVSLTPHQFQETKEHISFFETHFRKKGAEAARAAMARCTS